MSYSPDQLEIIGRAMEADEGSNPLEVTGQIAGTVEGRDSDEALSILQPELEEAFGGPLDRMDV